MKINKKSALLEGIGLLLLLLTFGFQIFEIHSASTKDEGHLVVINDKLNHLYLSLDDLRKIDDNNFSNDIFLKQFSDRNEHFTEWQDTKKTVSTVESQETVFKTIRIFLYIIGSILVIIPKIVILDKD